MPDETTFPFEILTLQKAFLRTEARFVIAPGQEGVFEILPGHAPFVFALKPGPLQIRQADGRDRFLAVGGGFLVVQPERTSLMTRSAEWPEDIDRERARRAKERAEQRLAQRSESLDVARAQAALQRSLARLRVADYAAGEK
jgi:F-type H+-transporting ATPase subunit epsilon